MYDAGPSGRDYGTAPPMRRRRGCFEHLLRLVCLLALAAVVAAVHDAVLPAAAPWFRLPLGLGGDPFAGKRVVSVLLVGTDQEAGLSDTIMVAWIDRHTKRAGLLSFPRDLLVRPPSGGSTKINAVVRLGQGAKDMKKGLTTLRQTLRDDLGIETDAYVRLDVKAFAQVVDALGGVDVTVPKGPSGKGLHYRDSSQNLSIALDPGPQHLDGKQAMGFVRWRQDQRGRGDGDIGRTKRQQEFLAAVAKRAAERMSSGRVLAARTALSLAGIAHRNTTTDLSLEQMAAIVRLARELDRGGIVAKTAPTAGQRTANGQFVFDPDRAGIREAARSIVQQLAEEPVPAARSK